MEGKDAIIERILSDATEKAGAILSDAKILANTKNKTAKDWVDNYKSTQEEILSKDLKDIFSRRATVADLDVRKEMLKARQDIISAVFDATYDKLCALNKKEYLSFVEKLLMENADFADVIVLSNDGALQKSDFNSIAIFSEKNLSISDQVGNFKGGFLLVGQTCDKDLSFKNIIESKKDELTAKVVGELFK